MTFELASDIPDRYAVQAWNYRNYGHADGPVAAAEMETRRRNRVSEMGPRVAEQLASPAIAAAIEEVPMPPAQRIEALAPLTAQA